MSIIGIFHQSELFSKVLVVYRTRVQVLVIQELSIE
jgi:hypothetical protein